MRLSGEGASDGERLRFPRVSWARARAPKDRVEGSSFGGKEDVVDSEDDCND